MTERVKCSLARLVAVATTTATTAVARFRNPDEIRFGLAETRERANSASLRRIITIDGSGTPLDCHTLDN